VVWSIPALVVIFLGGMAWISTHDLDPGKPLASDKQPLEIQVVALDWKWLFIYPEQGVASVNRLPVPAGTPLHFSITSAGVMNSFFVPQLGSQIYAMGGMATRLVLQADKPGTYAGLSAQYSGSGFSDMRFEVVALEPGAFDDWVRQTRGAGGTLDPVEYTRLVRPSSAVPPATFGAVAPKLFETAIHLTVR
jgi:cytochrome o ubiquinol oxidase subunit II